MPCHVSNTLLGIINFITFIFSIPILAAGVWLKKSGVTSCGLEADTGLIIIGVLIMIVSLLGFVGSHYRVTWLLWVYLVVVLVLIMFGLGSTALTLAMSNKGSGKELPGRRYKEYRLGAYSDWIQHLVNETRSWNKIKACMIDSKVCTVFNNKYLKDNLEKFYKQPLNAIQSGCCKPSDDCGFTYRGPTNWTEEKGAAYSNNPDCKAWDNDPKVLCFNCQSCKAGVADNIKHAWRKEATVSIVFLVLLVVVLCIGCCALINNCREWRN